MRNLRLSVLFGPVESVADRTVAEGGRCAETSPTVSIVCWSYNHEAFLAEAVESFLAQKTTFHVEIIIHDDASTDGTADVARFYEKKFPQVFRNILQPENLFQRGIDINGPPFARARGKYIALCEADDYWTRDDKLQKQVEFLECHPDCAGVFHRGHAVDATGNRIPFVFDNLEYQALYDQSECIFTLRSGYPTAALVFRRSALKFPLPRYFLESPTDFTTDVMLTDSGDLGFLDFDGCAYRQHSGGTWSTLHVSEMQRCGVLRLVSLHRDSTLRHRHPRIFPQVIRQLDVAWWNHFSENGGGWTAWILALSMISRLLLPRDLHFWIAWTFRCECPALFKGRDLAGGTIRGAFRLFRR